ncbi:MAG: hypothetical protein UHX00_08910 [Caryophanon sp.]|nr:hypothetical protein [Caryophanon sp.]
MSTYCATCDRVNGEAAKFCGGCGQPLLATTTSVGKYSFPLWLFVMVGASFFLPLTLYAAATGHEYIAVHAYNIVIGDASIRNVIMLCIVFISYSALTVFLCRHFTASLYRYGQMLCAVVGIVLSGYWLVHTIRAMLAATPIAEHTVLTLASVEQMTTLTYYVLLYYGALCLFYALVLLLCPKNRPTI